MKRGRRWFAFATLIFLFFVIRYPPPVEPEDLHRLYQGWNPEAHNNRILITMVVCGLIGACCMVGAAYYDRYLFRLHRVERRRALFRLDIALLALSLFGWYIHTNPETDLRQTIVGGLVTMYIWPIIIASMAILVGLIWSHNRYPPARPT